MKELFAAIPEKIPQSMNNPVLLDTCFLVHIFEHHEKIQKLKELTEKRHVGLTSFNIDEFLHIEHRVPEQVRHNIRKFLHCNPHLFKLKINVRPGNPDDERFFVRTVDEELLKHIADPSDAVLIACGIHLGADILTRDKHHLYTTELENFLQKYSISVMNKIE